MRIMLFVLIVITLLASPAPALAAPFNLSINIASKDRGIAIGELVYNGEVVWKVMFLSDGAAPVSGSAGSNMTIVVPEISKGMFMFKVNTNEKEVN